MIMKLRSIFYIIWSMICLQLSAQGYEEYFEIEETSPSDLNYNKSDLQSHSAEVYALKLDTSFKNDYRAAEYNYHRKKKIEKLKEKKNGDENNNKDGEPIDKDEPKDQEIPLEPKPERKMGFVPKVILNVFLGLAIIFILYVVFMILKDLRLKKKAPSTSTVSNAKVSDSRAIIEKDEGGELDHLLQKAITDKKYDLAVRYYFLIYLAGLQDKKLITYHKDKTNAEYIGELTDEHMSVFLSLSYHFEYMWYGKKHLEDAEFEQVQQLYQNTLKRYGV